MDVRKVVNCCRPPGVPKLLAYDEPTPSTTICVEAAYVARVRMWLRQPAPQFSNAHADRPGDLFESVWHL